METLKIPYIGYAFNQLRRTTDLFWFSNPFKNSIENLDPFNFRLIPEKTHFWYYQAEFAVAHQTIDGVSCLTLKGRQMKKPIISREMFSIVELILGLREGAKYI